MYINQIKSKYNDIDVADMNEYLSKIDKSKLKINDILYYSEYSLGKYDLIVCKIQHTIIEFEVIRHN